MIASADTRSTTILANDVSSCDVTSKPIENVFNGPRVLVDASAVRALESSPPLSVTPTGTSAIKCRSTASCSLARIICVASTSSIVEPPPNRTSQVYMETDPPVLDHAVVRRRELSDVAVDRLGCWHVPIRQEVV